MSKIILEGFISIPTENLAEVLEALKIHTKNTLNEEGCIVFEVNQDIENLNRLKVYEEFKDQEAFDLHQKRVKASDWGQITKNFKRNYSITSL